jgi:DNA mismatch repair protein MutS
MAVKEEKNSIIFLRKAVEGSAGSSYGIHVAKLAGLPREVISEATSFQKKHFADYSAFDSSQGDLFAQNDAPEENEIGEVLGKINDFDLDSSTPIEAMMFIAELKEIIKNR